MNERRRTASLRPSRAPRPAGVALGLTVGAIVFTAAGCSIAPPAPSPSRYFRVEAPAGPAEKIAPGSRGALRIRRVLAAGHVKDRFAVRTSDVEVGFDDLLRFTDPPAATVERALAAELFERRGFVRSESSRALRLDVEVRAFEEMRAPTRAARVSLWISLLDVEDRALLERTVTAEAPLTAGSDRDPEGVARALGEALANAAREAARLVAAAGR